MEVVQGFPYYTASRPVFQSRTKFWDKDKVSPNIVLGETALEHALEHGETTSRRAAA